MMNSLRWGVLGLLAATGLFAAACDSGSGDGPAQRPLDSLEATTAVNQRVEELLAGLGNASARLDMTDSTSVATGGINQATGSSSPCPVSVSTGGGSPETTTAPVDEAPASATKALDDLLQQVAQEAREHVFREEFVELQDGNQVTYKVDPASACGTDATCFEKLSTHPIRFVVTANTDDSLNVLLVVGLAQPASALLGKTKLSVRVDLAQVMNVLRLYVDPEAQADFPERLAGVIEGAIEKRGEGDFAITASVIEKLDLLVGQAKGKPVAVTVQPSPATAQLTINSLINLLGLSANLGAVDVQVAGAAVCDDSCGIEEQTGTFSAHLGGFTGAVAITNNTQELTLAGLGLGSSTSFVALNEGPLGTLDLNAANGRKVSISFKQTGEGTLVTFDPALDIKLAIMLNKLSESLRVDMPEWLSDEIFDVMLGGAAKPSILIPAATCDAAGNMISKNQVEVVTGQLTLGASSLASPISVPAGMCLLPLEGADSGLHPFSQLTAGVCQ